MPLPPGGLLRRPNPWVKPQGLARVDWSDPINQGLVACFVPGDSLYDLTGLHKPLTLGSGAQMFGPGPSPWGQGLVSPGIASPYTWFQSPFGITLSNFTIVGVAQWNTPASSTYQTIISLANTAAATNAALVYIQPSTGTKFDYYDSGAHVGAVSPRYPVAGSMCVISGVALFQQSVTVRLFSPTTPGGGGALVNTFGQTTWAAITPVNVMIGGWGPAGFGGDGCWAGPILSARVWNRALSIGELALLEARPWSGLVFPQDRVVLRAAPPPAGYTGTLAATEGADTAALSGTVAWPTITGTLAAGESGDTASLSGGIYASGTLATTEGADTAALAGTVAFPAITGTLATTEGLDAASFAGAGIALAGTLAAAETADHAAFTGFGVSTGTLAASEAGDTASFSGLDYTAGTLAAIETADHANVVGIAAYQAVLAAREAADISAITGTVPRPLVAAPTIHRETIIGALFNLLTAPPMVYGFTADTTTGSNMLTNVSDDSGLMVGMPVAGDGLPADTVITAIGSASRAAGGTVTVSLPAIADRVASDMTQGFQTTARRMADPNSEQDMPALYLVEVSEIHPPRGSTEAAIIEFHCEAWIFTKVGADPDAIPAATLNNLIDCIERALYPTPQGFRQTLGLEGVLYCRIEGEVQKDPGHSGLIAGAIIPIRIAVAQSVETVVSLTPLSFIRRR